MTRVGQDRNSTEAVPFSRKGLDLYLSTAQAPLLVAKAVVFASKILLDPRHLKPFLDSSPFVSSVKKSQLDFKV